MRLVETFARIVLRSPHDAPIRGREWTYFNFHEKGGLVDDPLFAAQASNISDYVFFMEDCARKETSGREWQRCRLIVDVQPFSDAVNRAMDENINEHLRSQAMKKLSAHELRALGL